MGPLFGRLGGKSRVASEIVARFPNHEKYVEPMVGGGIAKVEKRVDALENRIEKLEKWVAVWICSPNKTRPDLTRWIEESKIWGETCLG